MGSLYGSVMLCVVFALATPSIATNPKFIVRGHDVIKLIQDLGNPSPDVRLRAVMILGSLGSEAESARGPLQDVLANDPYSYIRMNAAEALGDMGDPNVVPVLKNSPVVGADGSIVVAWTGTFVTAP